MSRLHPRWLVLCCGVASIGVASLPQRVSAQDLAPELTGDYSEPAPAPTPRTRPSQERPAAQTSAPELDAEPMADPEAGDVGPVTDDVAPELSDESPEQAATSEDETLEESVELSAETSNGAPAQVTRFVLGLGFGAGTLSFSRPAQGGVQRLPTTPYAAADVDLRAQLFPSASLSLEVLLRYQSSIGWQIEVDPLFGLPENVPTRAQHVELSAAPVLRVSEDFSIAVPVGLAMRLFTPETHQYPVEPYALVSALVRIEGVAALSDSLTVRVGPEAHAVLGYNKALHNEGVSGTGGAIGAQATLQTRLGKVFSLALSYRELRSLIASAARFSDVERVITARVLGEL